MSRRLSGGSRRSLHRRLAGVQALFSRRRGPQAELFIDYPPIQTRREERVNGLIHAGTAVASFAGAVWLIAAAIRQHDGLMVLGCLAFGASLTSVFTMSALSHLVEAPRLRHLFRTLDQASIYLLTAGSYTPFFIRFLLPGGWDWVLPLLWGLTLLITWDKLRGDRVNSVSILPNIVLGWFPVIVARPLIASLPTGALVLAGITGGCYMLGVVFLLQDERRQYFHAIWHVLVTVGSACTFVGIAVYVL